MPTRCRVLVGTSAHPPAAFSRRRASAPMHRRVALTQFSAVWWGPCERLEPSLIIFAFTLLLMEKAKEVPAAVSPESAHVECRCPQTRRSSVWVSAPPWQLCSRSEQLKFCSGTRVPSHGVPKHNPREQNYYKA